MVEGVVCWGAVVSDDIMLAERYDQQAFALVVALHNGQKEAAEGMLRDATIGDLCGICVTLGMSLLQEWVESCEAEGVPFDEFVKNAGLWLAGGEV
jgi:hypothetical protein